MEKKFFEKGGCAAGEVCAPPSSSGGGVYSGTLGEGEEGKEYAYAGIPFAESKTWLPLLKKQERAKRGELERVYREAYKAARRAGASSEAARRAAAEAVSRAEQIYFSAGESVALGASGGKLAEKVKKRIEEAAERARELVLQLYSKAMSQLEDAKKKLEKQIADEYSKAMSQLEDARKKLEAEHVKRVKYKGREMTVDEWYSIQKKEIEAWRLKEEEKLSKWYSGEKKRLEEWRKTQLERIDRWASRLLERALRKPSLAREAMLEAYRLVEEFRASLPEWVPKLALYFDKLIREAEKRVRNALGLVEKWFATTVLPVAKKITREDAAKELADRVEKYVYSVLVGAGMDEAEAKRIAEKYSEKALDIAMKTVEASDKFIEGLERLYNKYSAMLKQLVGAESGVGAEAEAMREAETIISGFSREARALAEKLGVPLDYAETQIKAYEDALRSIAEHGYLYGAEARRAAEVAREYMARIASLASRIAMGGERALAELDRLLADAKRALLSVARREIAEKYYSELQRYAEEVRGKALQATSLAEKAEKTYRKVLQDLLKTRAMLANLDVFSERLKKAILGLAPPELQQYAEKLAEYYASKLRAEVLSKINTALARLPEADFICMRSGGTVTCKLYRNGKPLGVTLNAPYKPDLYKTKEWIQALLNAGYKPARIVMTGSPEEMERAELAYLRETNPSLYMARLGKKALSWEGKSPYEEVQELISMISEFYKIPSEKMSKWAVEAAEKGNIAAALGLGAGAALGGFASGLVSGAISFWDLPGVASFAKSVASGELAKYLAENPLSNIPELIGGIAGASLAAHYALSRAGRLAGRKLGGLGEKAVRYAGEAAYSGAFAYGLIQAALQGAPIAPLAVGVALLAKPKRKGKEREREREEEREIVAVRGLSDKGVIQGFIELSKKLLDRARRGEKKALEELQRYLREKIGDRSIILAMIREESGRPVIYVASSKIIKSKPYLLSLPLSVLEEKFSPISISMSESGIRVRGGEMSVYNLKQPPKPTPVPIAPPEEVVQPTPPQPAPTPTPTPPQLQPPETVTIPEEETLGEETATLEEGAQAPPIPPLPPLLEGGAAISGTQSLISTKAVEVYQLT